MSGAPVEASPVPLPVFPVPPLGSAAPLAAVVAAVDVVVVDVVDVVELPLLLPVVALDNAAEVAASVSSSVATFRSAATIAGVGGAAPKVSSSDAATGPVTKRMYCANFDALLAVSPDVGTTR